MTDDKKPAFSSAGEAGKFIDQYGNDTRSKPASAGREWRDEVAGNHEFWLLEDSGGQVRVIYDPPPSFFKMPTIHVVRQSALAEAEKQFAEYRAMMGKSMLDFQAKVVQLDVANARIAELELLAHVTDESSYRAKTKRLVEENERLKAQIGDSRLYAQAREAERDRYKLALESAAKDRGLGYDEFIEMHLEESIKGGV